MALRSGKEERADMAHKSLRARQTERGLEAVKMLADFLEGKDGVLTVSIHESKYSSGVNGCPDLVYDSFAIEVKRVEFLTRHKFDKGEHYWTQLGQMSLLHESWERLKQWSKNNGKTPLIVLVLTVGKQDPLFVKLTQTQIDDLQQLQRGLKWVKLSSWQALTLGEVWR